MPTRCDPKLERELGGNAPDSLGRLSAAEQERLAGLLKGARTRQQAALERAVDEGLGFLPRPVRAVVTRVLF